MKNIKKILSSVLACLMVVISMFALTACDNKNTTPTPTPTPTPTAEPTKETLDATQAEYLYFEALRNSIISKERKSITTYYNQGVTGIFEKSMECQTILKDNIFNIKYTEFNLEEETEISWIKDKKYYKESTKKYYEDYTSIRNFEPLEHDITEILKFANTKCTFDFQGAEVLGDITTIYANIIEDDGEIYTHRIAVEIKDKLVRSLKLFSYDISGSEGTLFVECTATYSNVQFATTLPEDLDTYELATAGGLTPVPIP